MFNVDIQGSLQYHLNSNSKFYAERNIKEVFLVSLHKNTSYMKKTSIKIIVTRKNRYLFTISILFLVLFYIWSGLYLLSIFILFLILIPVIKINSKSILNKKTSKYLYTMFLAIFLANFLRVFFFDIYHIPSSSMESKLFVGDRVVINKLIYGPRKPETIDDIPFGGIFKTFFSKEKEKKYIRLKGMSKIKRHDIVVYKSAQNTNYIKRIIGLPGDTLAIINSGVFINNISLDELPTYKFNYRLKKDTTALRIFNFSNSKFLNLEDKDIYKRHLYRKNETIVSVFPTDKIFEWNLDNYGEIIIPEKDQIIYLNTNNIEVYKKYIESETRKIISLKNDTIFLDQKVLEKYKFRSNYYFMMGDNRHYSNDSRSKGFISEEQIEGKLSFIL
jgi:signal peptidase I